MAVHYRLIDGEYVSDEWFTVLSAMRRDGVQFHVNEGHRTMARQAFFYAGWLSRRPGFALAAFPSPTAPHIRTGRIDHAIDFNGASAAIAWCRRHGLSARLTVPGESWHVEVPANQLRAYAAHHGTEDPTLRRGSVNRTATTRLQRLLRGRGLNGVPLNGRYDLATRKAVRRFQEAHHQPVDGVVGPKTWAALRKAP